MSERWMHRPRTVNIWEARRSLRYGSESVGHFKTEEAARDFAEKDIKANGNVGRVGEVTRYLAGGVLYYDVHAPEI